ncbi:hypothetical protein KAU08_09795 [bacterium]|nr:hypothetical protein [bacterium]
METGIDNDYATDPEITLARAIKALAVREMEPVIDCDYATDPEIISARAIKALAVRVMEPGTDNDYATDPEITLARVIKALAAETAPGEMVVTEMVEEPVMDLAGKATVGEMVAGEGNW